MAGIGFELKKLFAKKGLFALIRAYGYSGIICTGPMLLGMALLVGVKLIAMSSGMAHDSQELLNCMITYTLLASLMTTNVLSMVTTRYVADVLFVGDDGRVMPSFYGSIAIMLTGGGFLYAVFLHFSGVGIAYQLCCLVFYMELIVVWTQINYLTAVKDYRGIMLAFAASICGALLIGWLLVRVLHREAVLSLMISVIIGYGIMLVWYYKLLIEYFPECDSGSFDFLKWFDKYPQLAGVGTFIGIGLFAHLVLMWASPAGVQVKGLFYGAPIYDVSALMAFLSILITTINFVTSVEVKFYPKYRIYYGLYNKGGTLIDIQNAEKELISTLNRELGYTFAKQFFASVIFIVLGTLLIPRLPLGFTEEMLGIYRVLCVGYAFYSAGNCVMLMSLYFADNAGALVDTAIYAACSVIGTIITMHMDTRFYGFGFLVAGIVFTGISLTRVTLFTRKLSYHVISCQPFTNVEITGVMTRLSEKLEERYRERKERLKKAQ